MDDGEVPRGKNRAPSRQPLLYTYDANDSAKTTACRERSTLRATSLHLCVVARRVSYFLSKRASPSMYDLLPISRLCLPSHVFASHSMSWARKKKLNIIPHALSTQRTQYTDMSTVFDPSTTKKNSTHIKYDTTHTAPPAYSIPTRQNLGY